MDYGHFLKESTDKLTRGGCFVAKYLWTADAYYVLGCMESWTAYIGENNNNVAVDIFQPVYYSLGVKHFPSRSVLVVNFWDETKFIYGT